MRATTGVLAGLAVVALAVVWAAGLDEAGEGRGPRPDRSSASEAIRSLPEAVPSVAPGGAEESAPDALDVEAWPLATLQGRVVDQRHEPAGGVSVFLVQSATQFFSDNPYRAQASAGRADRISTDAAGSFRFRQPAAGRLLLALQQPGFARQVVGEIELLPGTTVDVGDITLRDPRMIAGRVQDLDGVPLAGAEVLCTDVISFFAAWKQYGFEFVAVGLREHEVPDEAWIQSFVAALPQAAPTVTATDGTFSVPLMSVTEADYIVMARAPGHTIEILTDDDQRNNAPQDLVLTLRPAAGSVAGRVACPGEAALPSDTIVMATADPAPDGTQYGRVVRVAPDGSFAIEGLLAVPTKVQAMSLERGASPWVQVAPGTRDVLLTLGAPCEVTVHVLQDGLPAEHFELSIGRTSPWSMDGLEWETRSAGPGDHGCLSLANVRFGMLTVRATAGERSSEPIEVVIGDEKLARDLKLDLLPGRSVAGTVLDRASREPIAGAVVSVHTKVGLTSFHRQPGACDFTSRAGHFSIGPLAPVPMTVDVQTPGYVEQTLEAPADPAAELTFELVRHTLVQVRVGAVLGDALRVGALSLWDDDADLRVTPVDHEGKARDFQLGGTGLFLDDLDPGRYRVELIAGGGNTLAPEFSALPGELVVVDL